MNRSRGSLQKFSAFAPATLTFLLTLTVVSRFTFGDGPRVYPLGEIPNDVRLQPPKDLNGYFPFKPPSSREVWEKRARQLRRRTLVATGLWPQPEKTPLRASIYGRSSRDGFTTEKVHFESYPGHFVTGILFRPEGEDRNRPAVLCPHGHGGRLQDHGNNIRKLIVEGQERFEGSGRFPKLARCAQLARMGCVTFIFDMAGYADSVQISYELAHRHRNDRPEFDTETSWGFYSTQAELRLQSIFGVQTWNSVRALDFLSSLPDVDASRIAVTGGSGGGTQTIILGAIDPRPVAAFPQGMVSTSMQGGCTCENCSLLRIGSGNVELAALFAPRPLGMTAANDWTRAMMTEGYPSLRTLYYLYGAEDKVACKSLLHFPHNYNYVTRALMYSWFNRHLRLGLSEPIVEGDFSPLTSEEMSVWDTDHPKPSGGEDYERRFTLELDAASRKQLAALTPKNTASLGKYREVVGGAFEAIVGRGLPRASDIERIKVTRKERSGYLEFTDVLQLRTKGEEFPVVSLHPEKQFSGDVVLWISGQGKSGLFQDDGAVHPHIRLLLDAGQAVISADLFLQGEFLKDGKPVTRTRKVSNERQFAGYTFGYNDTLFVRRVHDILTLISWIRGDERTRRLHIAGLRGAGPWVALASAIAGNVIDRRLIDTNGFRFVNLDSWLNPNFLPGAVKYGDLPGILSLSTPAELMLLGEDGDLPALITATYSAVSAASRLHSVKGEGNSAIRSGAEWVASTP